jgi:hypothetical protein
LFRKLLFFLNIGIFKENKWSRPLFVQGSLGKNFLFFQSFKDDDSEVEDNVKVGALTMALARKGFWEQGSLKLYSSLLCTPVART